MVAALSLWIFTKAVYEEETDLPTQKCSGQQEMKMAVFWVVVPYILVEVYQCFKGPCCLHHQ
jgi:hypothetical protein